VTASAPATVAALGATLGEGPVWVAREAALWFVDIKEKKLHRFDPAGGAPRSWDAPAQPGWILPCADGGFVVGLQGGLHLFDPASGAFALLAPVEPDRPGNRLNDACTDAEGRIWLGTMDDAEEADTGAFYRFADGRLAEAGLPRVCITNGPAVSPDGRVLYHVDTLGRTLWACDLGADGALSAPRRFATIAEGEGWPDGPCVDSEGHVWIGLFGGWGARRYAPDGALVETVRFPVANVTKLAFGGADLRTVYATTAAKGLSARERAAQPEAGNLFAFRVDVAGAPVTPARLAKA
jgi:sugar lactone lactonase YvrE